MEALKKDKRLWKENDSCIRFVSKTNQLIKYRPLSVQRISRLLLNGYCIVNSIWVFQTTSSLLLNAVLFPSLVKIKLYRIREVFILNTFCIYILGTGIIFGFSNVIFTVFYNISKRTITFFLNVMRIRIPVT